MTGFNFLKKTQGHGFALLLAVLISSVLLAIGISILNITYKELILSSTIRNSHRAFYVADTAVECARYWDRENTFATSSSSGSSATLDCGGNNSVVTVQSSSPVRAISTFALNIASSDMCANVLVTKETSRTVIEARGYNTCDVSSPRRVERGLRLTLE